jgi:hypothetical protein
MCRRYALPVAHCHDNTSFISPETVFPGHLNEGPSQAQVTIMILVLRLLFDDTDNDNACRSPGDDFHCRKIC